MIAKARLGLNLFFGLFVAYFTGMALANPVGRLTEAEHLEIERAAEFKSEFFNGEMFARSSATRWHRVIANTFGLVGQALKPTEWFVHDLPIRQTPPRKRHP